MKIMFQVYTEAKVSPEKQRKGWWPSKQLKKLDFQIIVAYGLYMC